MIIFICSVTLFYNIILCFWVAVICLIDCHIDTNWLKHNCQSEVNQETLKQSDRRILTQALLLINRDDSI